MCKNANLKVKQFIVFENPYHLSPINCQTLLIDLHNRVISHFVTLHTTILLQLEAVIFPHSPVSVTDKRFTGYTGT
uniref:Uncharacterized protein n=1 Tax=Arundo donax TaxID=35708 RepID=A0A0A8Z5G6_ARUDO